MVIALSSNSKVESRQAYTLFELLGDFGGFNDAIYFLLSLPMGFYSSAMYNQHVASLFRYKKKSRKKAPSDQERLSKESKFVQNLLNHETSGAPSREAHSMSEEEK